MQALTWYPASHSKLIHLLLRVPESFLSSNTVIIEAFDELDVVDQAWPCSGIG
ncbi:MAG: hypothetical protein AAGG59_01265 [Bacteroidota bacterium]